MTTPAPRRIPHRCPVCVGRGIVAEGLYSSTNPNGTWTMSTAAGSEPCRSCQGSGVVWEIVDA